MNKRKISLMLVLSLVLLTNIIFASAITAKIGNARAVINAEVGDTLERTIKVINDNDVDVEIELFASGNLSEDVKIIDNNFTLIPGEERDARFEVYISEKGNHELRINVKFIEVGEKQGVGIASTLIINAAGKSIFDDFFGGDDDEGDSNLNNPSEGSDESGPSSGILLIVVLLLILVALAVIFFYLKKRAQNSKKKVDEKTKQKKKVRKS